MPKEVTTGRWRDAKRQPNRQVARFRLIRMWVRFRSPKLSLPCKLSPNDPCWLFGKASLYEAWLRAQQVKGCNMKDEIAHDIAKELRLIREELQKLTSAVKSIASRSQNYNKSGKSYQGRTSLPSEPGPPGGRKPQGTRRPEEARRQWHLPEDAK